ncbi:MAG TPA: hypothetical protein VF992_06110 [Thermoplasmata archaeon]
MSHRRNPAKIAERKRQERIEGGDLIDKMAASPWLQRRGRELSKLLRLNIRGALALTAGFATFQALDPWTTSLADRALPILVIMGFAAALVVHRRYLP